MLSVRCKARSLALSSAAVSESKESGDGDDTATLYWLKQAAGKSTLRRHPGHGSLRNVRLCRLPPLSRLLSCCRRAAVALSLCVRGIPRRLRLDVFREISAFGDAQP